MYVLGFYLILYLDYKKYNLNSEILLEILNLESGIWNLESGIQNIEITMAYTEIL